MSLKYGKAEIKAMSEVLDGDYDSVEEAAEAAIAAAEEIFERRAKFVVVGQLAGNRERQTIPPGDPEAIKLSLGWYSTEGDARGAAESLWSSTATGDSFRVWVLPVHHGTPAELHAKRKAQYQEAEEKRAHAQRQRLRDQIKKREEENAIRAGGGKGACQCGHPVWEHKYEGSSRGACALPECHCEKWDEKKR